MQQRLTSSPALALALLCSAGLTSIASAAPLVLDKNEAVADIRRDTGTGICGNVIKFANQPQPLATTDDAVTLLNKPMGDPNIMGKTARQLLNMNFTNNALLSPGDFFTPMFNDEVLPFCNDPMSSPMGTDDNNVALRLRGYINITNTLGGQPSTFAINCDDGCILKLGKSRQMVMQADERSPILTGRQARHVTFRDAGLYPVELVYFQNATTAYMEWSRALSKVFVAEDPKPIGNAEWSTQASNFKPIAGSDLYSAIVGASPTCEECGAPGMNCAAGTFCGDGLCQACNLPDHCGPTCQTCPANAHICSAGKCVQCTSDMMCAPGESCNTMTGMCVPPLACIVNMDCPPPQVCKPDGFCGNPSPPCKTDAECLAGQICACEDGTTSCAQKVCITPPTKCTSDADCNMFQFCDTAVGICKAKNRYLYEGGLGCSMSSGTSSSGPGGAGFGLLAVLGLALFGLSARLRRRGVGQVGLVARKAALLLVPVFFCVVVTDAKAQTQPQNGPISVNAQIFHPALGPENIITVEGTRTPGKWVPMANALFEFAHQPLRLTDTFSNTSNAVVPYMFTLHLMGGIGLTRWLAVGVDLPIVVYEAYNKLPGTGFDIPNNPNSAGVGDLRLIGKFRILDNTEGGFGLGFVPQITFPTGSGVEFRGDDAFGFEPRFALDYKTKKGFIVALNVGVLLRTEDQLARNIRVSHQIHYGLGAFIPLPKGFGLAGELTGGTSFFNSESIYSPLEAYIAGRWIHRTGINVNLGGGPGLTPVAGSAQFRLFASVGYLPMERKKEPPKRQIVDLDPDRDGLIGAHDRCPTEWGPPENQGCPDIDTDKDGLIDRLDKCPKEPGPKENQGCPDTDRDGDGLVDRLDSCPDQPGPLENNGCPLMDTDKDGIPDKDDKCPYEPGPKETQGCPPPHKYITVTQEKIELLQKIMFATNKSDIKAVSFDLLNEVVSVLKSRPAMRVHVEGHTDVRGTLQWNMKLSKMRSDSVTKYLVDHGVEAERLTSEGYGPTRPLCPDKTTACFDKNRRTEFVITAQ